MRRKESQIGFSSRKLKIGFCSALISSLLMGSFVNAVEAVESSKFNAINHDVKELSASQVAQIMKGIPELGKLNCGDTVHFAFEKNGKVVVTNEVSKKGGGITTTIKEPTKEIEETAKKALPDTGVGESSFNQAVLIGFITIGATVFVIYKRKQSAKALVLLLAIGGIGYATNVNAISPVFNTSYSVEKSSMTTPSVEGYKYVGYWVEPGNCDIPNNYPTVEFPSVEFKVPNDYPKVELPEGQVPKPNTGNVVVRYVADDSGEEIKELLKLKENEKDKTPYKTERIPIIDAGDYIYKLVEEKLPSNEDGAVAEGKTIEVVYRYVKEIKKGSIIVEYIEESSGEKIREDFVLLDNALVNSDYIYSPIKIVVNQYDGTVYALDEDQLPNNNEGKVKEGTTKLTYKYKKTTDYVTDSQVYARYVVKKTGEIINEHSLGVDRIVGEEYDFTDYKIHTRKTHEYKGKTYNIIGFSGLPFIGTIQKHGLDYVVIELEDPEDTSEDNTENGLANIIVKYIMQYSGKEVYEHLIATDRPVGSEYDETHFLKLHKDGIFKDSKTNKTYKVVGYSGVPFSGTIREAGTLYAYVELEEME